MGVDSGPDYPKLPAELLECRCAVCGMHFFKPEAIGRPDLYEKMGRHHWYYERFKWEYSETLTILANERPRHLLELGCGTGNFLHQASRFAEVVSGIEFNPEAVRKCVVSGLDVKEESIAKIQGAFDAIVSFQVMEHLQNVGEVIANCVDKLSPGGLLIISVPNQDGVLGKIEMDFLNLPPHHATRWEKDCFKFVAAHHGLELEHYASEAASLSLYATYMLEQLSKLKIQKPPFTRVFSAIMQLISRAHIPSSYEAVGRHMPGHTHLAAFRRPSAVKN